MENDPPTHFYEANQCLSDWFFRQYEKNVPHGQSL